MVPPDSRNKDVFDYNEKKYSKFCIHYDIKSQKKPDNIKFTGSQTNWEQWLKPFISLLYMILELDIPFHQLKIVLHDFMGSNFSVLMPNTLVIATKYSHIKMIDISVTHLNQFDVHKQFLFDFELTNNSLYSISFEDYEFNYWSTGNNMVIPDAFILHMSECTCYLLLKTFISVKMKMFINPDHFLSHYHFLNYSHPNCLLYFFDSSWIE